MRSRHGGTRDGVGGLRIVDPGSLDTASWTKDVEAGTVVGIRRARIGAISGTDRNSSGS